jgi:hypothetical protein
MTRSPRSRLVRIRPCSALCACRRGTEGSGWQILTAPLRRGGWGGGAPIVHLEGHRTAASGQARGNAGSLPAPRQRSHRPLESGVSGTGSEWGEHADEVRQRRPHQHRAPTAAVYQNRPDLLPPQQSNRRRPCLFPELGLSIHVTFSRLALGSECGHKLAHIPNGHTRPTGPTAVHSGGGETCPLADGRRLVADEPLPRAPRSSALERLLHRRAREVQPVCGFPDPLQFPRNQPQCRMRRHIHTTLNSRFPLTLLLGRGQPDEQAAEQATNRSGTGPPGTRSDCTVTGRPVRLVGGRPPRREMSEQAAEQVMHKSKQVGNRSSRHEEPSPLLSTSPCLRAAVLVRCASAWREDLAPREVNGSV